MFITELIGHLIELTIIRTLLKLTLIRKAEQNQLPSHHLFMLYLFLKLTMFYYYLFHKTF